MKRFLSLYLFFYKKERQAHSLPLLSLPSPLPFFGAYSRIERIRRGVFPYFLKNAPFSLSISVSEGEAMPLNKRGISPVNTALVLAVLALSALFILESDDCYFFYWKYDSLLDFLLTRPDTTHAHIVSVPQNGRYLGNLLGVCLAKCFESPLFPLRIVFYSGGLFLLSWGGSAVLVSRERRREAFFFLLSMLLLAHRGIWQEVYSWGAAYANYLTPMAVLCCLPLLLRRGEQARRPGGWCALLVLLSVTCCLFMETVTLFLLAAASLALLEQLWMHRRLSAPFFGLWLGTVTGTAVMFSAPGYGAVGSDGLREAGLELMYQNFCSIFIGTLVRPAIPALIITGFLLWHLRRQRCRWWLVCTLAAVPIHLVCLGAWCRDLTDPGNLLLPEPSLPLALVGMALAALWLLMVLLWQGGRAKQTILRLILALCLFSGPLLVVSIGGNRNFFPGFVVLCLVCLVLFDSAREAGLKPIRWPRVSALLACCALIFIYGVNCRVYYQRMGYARAQVAAGSEQITLPLLPFAGFARNEQEWKGDLSYQIYRETPWDVGFTFVSYETWTQSGQCLGGDCIDPQT